MAMELTKRGADVLIGGGLGMGRRLINKADKTRVDQAIAAAKTPPGAFGQVGTYYCYGLPVLAVLGTAFGVLKGDWATRAVTGSSVLLGDRLTWQLTKPKTETAPAAFTEWQQVLAQEKAAAAANAGRGSAARGSVMSVTEFNEL